MNPSLDENANRSRAVTLGVTLIVLGVGIISWTVWWCYGNSVGLSGSTDRQHLNYVPRGDVDSAGYLTVGLFMAPWQPNASLQEISAAFKRPGKDGIEQIDKNLTIGNIPIEKRTSLLLAKASLWNYQGDPKRAYQSLEQARSLTDQSKLLAQTALYSIIMFQGISALRLGENENCIMCRGESSCILPISKAAVHTNPEGSRLAIRHFTEYLTQFPDDLEIRWLLNLAYMTLGEHPQKVPPEYLVSLDHFLKSEFDIGKFRDIGHKVGINHCDQAGGVIMEDFDNDGLLDIINTSYDPTKSMTYYHNDGHGRFENRSVAAGLGEQLGGLNCMQTDYDNDGYMDIFVVRGAWVNDPMRPSLLHNNKNGTFTDVTEDAGLLHSANSIAASWADYDNDGWLDLFVCGEKQTSCLYRNQGNGTFEDVSVEAGLHQPKIGAKGAAWIDHDNDGYPDLFVNYLLGKDAAQLFHNNRDGTFRDATDSLGIHGPVGGFSCWAWDYDNDGWLDIFATCYDFSEGDIVKGLQGQSHQAGSNRLYHNRQGKGFDDVTKEAGLDMVFATMGSNFGDFDNDGLLDFYLGTGAPRLSMLVPNRMFKNVDGQRFAEITASSGTGSLQKGHGVACGDWDRDGNTDIFIEMGGAVPGDQYHNILFQNPGHQNNWLTVKLIGQKTNRAALGARIKVVTMQDGGTRTIHRHISSGSSFGGNPLQQTIGLGKAERISQLEIYWPTSQTTQVFRDIATDQAIEITEFAGEYRSLDWKPIPIPKSE